MVAYSFKTRFIDPILTGRKRQTIRAHRKRHARPGEELQLYQGMRTKACRLIGKATCQETREITISFPSQVRRPEIIVTNEHGMRILQEPHRFAMDDGFINFADMLEFWRAEHPKAVAAGWFKGVFITWGDLLELGPEYDRDRRYPSAPRVPA